MSATRKKTSVNTSALTIGLIALVLVTITTNTSYAQVTPNLYTNTSVNTRAQTPRNDTGSSGVPGIDEQISVDITPEISQPGKDVTISVRTYGVDTNTNMYTWTINNRQVLKGFGEFKLTFKAGMVGEVSNVKVSIVPSVGMAIERTFSINPVAVDMLWQAKTYTPPFYKGKALYTPESEVTIVSLPSMVIQNRRINPAEVVYNWKINYDLKFQSSGYGRNSFTYKGPIINKNDSIQTEVYASSNKNIAGRNNLYLNRVNPEVLFYEDHPTLGILFNRNISGDVFMSGKEFKLIAYPYNFSSPDRSQNTTFNWFLNDSKLNIENNQSTTVFRRTDVEAGESSISVVVGNPTHILQKASSFVNVIYDKSTDIVNGAETGGFGTEN